MEKPRDLRSGLLSGVMRTLILTRFPSTDEGTFGRIKGDGLSVRSLELPWKENEPKRSCIPLGSYTCKLVRSPKFGRVYGLVNVLGRDHILIHAANLAGDSSKGFVSDLEGCIAPYLIEGRLVNNLGNEQRAGLSSRSALRMLMDWARKDDFQLRIQMQLPTVPLV